MNLKLTVVFGNRNSFVFEISSLSKVRYLYKSIMRILHLKPDDILFLISSCGKVLGETSAEMDGAIYKTGLFASGSGVVNLIYRHRELSLDNQSLRVMMNYLHDQDATNELSGLGFQQLMIGLATASQPQQDEIVVISNETYDRSVSQQVVENEAPVCMVCHEEVLGTLHVLRCQHHGHSSCLRNWFTQVSTRCPMCQTDIRNSG